MFPSQGSLYMFVYLFRYITFNVYLGLNFLFIMQKKHEQPFLSSLQNYILLTYKMYVVSTIFFFSLDVALHLQLVLCNSLYTFHSLVFQAPFEVSSKLTMHVHCVAVECEVLELICVSDKSTPREEYQLPVKNGAYVTCRIKVGYKLTIMKMILFDIYELYEVIIFFDAYMVLSRQLTRYTLKSSSIFKSLGGFVMCTKGQML